MFHSFSPPARWGLLDFLRVVLLLLLLLLLLLHHLCLHFHVHFRLANSSPSSSPTSARSGHCWTSTARVWAHCAPLDLNLGPSELSEHRWTSTWDPPSSVSTAGPQPGTLRAQWAPLDLNGQIECQKICQIERQIECQKECQKICQIKCQNVCQNILQKICQIECQKICQIECQIECHKVCQIKCQNVCQIERRYAR